MHTLTLGVVCIHYTLAKMTIFLLSLSILSFANYLFYMGIKELPILNKQYLKSFKCAQTNS